MSIGPQAAMLAPEGLALSVSDEACALRMRLLVEFEAAGDPRWKSRSYGTRRRAVASDSMCKTQD